MILSNVTCVSLFVEPFSLITSSFIITFLLFCPSLNFYSVLDKHYNSIVVNMHVHK